MDVLFVLLILFVAFYLQSVVGFASGLVAAPFLILFLSFPEMVFLLSVIGLFFASYQVPKVFSSAHKRMLLFLFPSLLVGMFFGVRSLAVFSRSTLELVLVAVIVLGLFLIVFRSRIRLPESAGVIVGFLGGFFSGSVSVGGPVYASYIDSQTSSVVARSTLIVLLALVEFFKLSMLVFSGFVSSSILVTALLAVPVVFLAMFLGNKASGLLSQRVYHASVFVLVLLAAVLVIM
ncbi:MAG: TSUP family transporter [Candidatus Woesearchaeota archaeon]